MDKNVKELIWTLLLILAVIVGVVLYYKIFVTAQCEILGIEPTLKNMLALNFLFSHR